MKRSIILIIILCLLIGFILNVPSTNDINRITNNKLKAFEEEIVVKDNNINNNNFVIRENIVNKAGKKIESFIDTGFKYIFSYIKKGINDEK